MKETINNIHVISKGIVLSIILHMIVIGFLVVTGFNSSLFLFTVVLLAVMAASGFYVGTISERYAEINGLILAVFISTIVLLYIAQYTEMNWAVNRILISSYLVIGFLSSLISRLTNKKQKIKNNLVKADNTSTYVNDDVDLTAGKNAKLSKSSREFNKFFLKKDKPVAKSKLNK
ncbi:hypothetical protein MZM54_01915 [[Brevibacterium] frigoritolerans]|nr:hypothetical protein [Peribacillus frigoritolerans]